MKTNDVEADAKALTSSRKVVRRILAATLGGPALLLVSPPETASAAAQCRAAWSVSSVQGGSYTYLSGITAWTPGAGWAVGNTLTATIAESICEIQVSETRFDPATAPAVQGDTIGWTIVSDDSHRLKDRSGMALFDSGTLGAGSSFQYTFNSAGTYPVTDRATHATSSVAVPVPVPSTGKAGKPFLVTWSAAAPATGFVFDMQIRVLPDRSFHDWLVGQPVTAANYVPAIVGTYAFRARSRWPPRWRSLKMVATGYDNHPKSLGILEPATGNLFVALFGALPTVVKTEELGSTNFAARTGCRADAGPRAVADYLARDSAVGERNTRIFAVEPITSC